MDAPRAHRRTAGAEHARTHDRLHHCHCRTTSTRCASRSSADAGSSATDTADAARVALVNNGARAQLGAHAIRSAHESVVDEGETWMTVVGVTANVRQFSLEKEPEAQVYIPLTQSPMGLPGRVLVRTQGDEQAMSQIIRAVVHDVDPNVPVKNISTLEELRRRYLSKPLPHRCAAGSVCGSGPRRDADGPCGGDGHVGVAADAGVRRPARARRAARRARARRPPPGRGSPGARPGARHRGRVRGRSRPDAYSSDTAPTDPLTLRREWQPHCC